jgi:hypothetical protein
MKTMTINFCRTQVGGVFLLLLISFSQNIQAQKGIEIQVSAYPGYTAVNFEKALGYSDEYMNDWDQFYYSFSLKGYLVSDKPISYGAEIGWQRLYYAYYRVPYGDSPVYREFNISTFSIMGLARYSPNQKFFIAAGAGVHFFNDGVAPAIMIEPGYMIIIGENLKIPLSIRLNPIFGDGIPTTVSLGIGISYKIR